MSILGLSHVWLLSGACEHRVWRCVREKKWLGYVQVGEVGFWTEGLLVLIVWFLQRGMQCQSSSATEPCLTPTLGCVQVWSCVSVWMWSGACADILFHLREQEVEKGRENLRGEKEGKWRRERAMMYASIPPLFYSPLPQLPPVFALIFCYILNPFCLQFLGYSCCCC